MPFTFQEADSAFKKDRIRELYGDPQGLRFLKLRSLYRASRPHYIEALIHASGIDVGITQTKKHLEALYESAVTDAHIESTIRSIHNEERAERAGYEDELISELYKLRTFDWGGLHQNSLEKTIVDNYVKRIRSFDDLSQKIDNELHDSMRGYVLCSWYNHWTSIIIEDIFKDHPAVLPTVGQIKKIDFFIGNIPFDLKVTNLAEGFISDKRKSCGLRPELTLMKQTSRKLGIYFDESMSSQRLLEYLWLQLEDHPSERAADLLEELRSFRLQLLEECQQNPTEYMIWLYENQGVRRFDASNRLFLVLVDSEDFFKSWRLKRAKPLLVDRISAHLDTMRNQPGQEVSFSWDHTPYKAVSDMIFVVR